MQVCFGKAGADLCHKAKVEDADLALRGADEVARVRVGMQEAGLQQLDEVAVEQGSAQLPHIPCCALTQLLTCAQMHTHTYIPTRTSHVESSCLCMCVQPTLLMLRTKIYAHHFSIS